MIFFINSPFFLIIYRRDNLITKVYNYLKENIKFFIFLIILFIVLTFKFPYYIDTPGGLLDVNDRVYIEDSYENEGSFNCY